MQQAFLGIKKDYSQWDDLSDKAATLNLALTTQQLATLRTDFNFDELSPQDQLSYRLFEYKAEQDIASFVWRFHEFPVNQMRYLVMPGQATAYKIGMLKILELRKHSMAELGNGFDIRQFHDAVLANGPMPLDLLEEQVQQWIGKTKQGP
jgi:uncharacterized protein (DUF885 family)